MKSLQIVNSRSSQGSAFLLTFPIFHYATIIESAEENICTVKWTALGREDCEKILNDETQASNCTSQNDNSMSSCEDS